MTATPPPADPLTTAASATLALAIVEHFLAGQISAGAAEGVAVARLVRGAVAEVARTAPTLAAEADRLAEDLLSRMPEDW